MTAITAVSQNAMHAAHERGFHSQTIANRSYPVFGLSSWQVRTIKALAGLNALQHDWDSYGSESISDKVLDIATDLVSGAMFQIASTPRVVPVSGGGVQLEWSRGSRALDIYISPNLSIDITARDGDAVAEATASSISPVFFESLLSWLQAA